MGLFFVITPYQTLVNLVEMPHLTVYKPQPQHICWVIGIKALGIHFTKLPFSSLELVFSGKIDCGDPAECSPFLRDIYFIYVS